MDVCTNEQYLIYSSISPVVNLVDLETLSSKSERLFFVDRNENGYDNWFGLMSIKFSGDNKEIVGGTKKN